MRTPSLGWTVCGYAMLGMRQLMQFVLSAVSGSQGFSEVSGSLGS